MSKYILSEDLAVWFGKKKKKKGSSQPKGPWVNICKKKKGGGHPPCGRKDADEGGYPVCRGAGVAGKMSQSEKDSACRRKREKEKKDTQTGKGQKPTRIKVKNYKKESIDPNLIQNVLQEFIQVKKTISEDLQYHIENNIPLSENMFRAGSPKYFDVINEARKLREKGLYENELDNEILDSDLGKFFIYEGERLPLDFPMINEAEYKGKKVELGKPKSGGSKKWYVYVRNPKTGKIKKVSYGSPVMTAKWNDPAARKSFAARHQCAKKKDKTKAGYWACRAHKDFGKNVPGRFW
ncbi:hypothetical protein N9H63_01460 [bacterium]|nr:hypothetical protein [bacterium]